MSVRLNGSTSGYTELDAPAVAGNNTIKMPASNGAANQFVKNGSTAGELTYATATEDSSGNFAFNSGYGSVAPVYGCRAWVNFDGTKDTTGATSTANTNRLIRASGNVTSVLRNGTGDYTITFTTAMPDANYAVNGLAKWRDSAGTAAGVFIELSDKDTASNVIKAISVRISFIAGSTFYDPIVASVAIFR
jgi:hypothetical protein